MRLIMTISLAACLLLAVSGQVCAQPSQPQPREMPKMPEYQAVKAGQVKVNYTEGWKKEAEKLAEEYSEALSSASKNTGVTPEMGIEIVIVPLIKGAPIPLNKGYNQQSNTIVWPIFFPADPKDYNQDLTLLQGDLINLSFLACQTQLYKTNQMLVKHPEATWFVSGFCYFYAVEAMKDIYGDSHRAPPFSDAWLAAARDTIFRAKPGKRGFAPEYQAAFYRFFAELHKKYGKKRYAAMIKAVINLKKYSADEIIKTIDSVTGGDCVKLCKEYKTDKEYPFLGIQTDPKRMEPGVEIVVIVEGSSAAEAGLMKGDIIVKANGKPINSLGDLQAVISKAGVGAKLKMIIDRDGSRSKIIVTLKPREFKFDEETPLDKPAPPPGRAIPRTREQLLSQAGFTQEQVELLMLMFEKSGSMDWPFTPEDKAKVERVLSEAGFSPAQIQALSMIFKLK